jgi:hypothetical protein
MATDSLNVISTSILAASHPIAAAIPSPFASRFSITGIAMAAAGVLAGGIAVSVMAINDFRRDQ